MSIGGSFLVGPTLGYQGANQFFNGADTRLALANRVTGQESPAELAGIGAQDKAAALQQAQGGINYEYATAWQEANDRRRREEAQRNQNRLNVFG